MGTAVFLDGIRTGAEFGVPTVETLVDGIPYFTGQFWTAKQRQGHALHEISYRGCFKPDLPAFFIDRLSVPGEAVYDPFAGRGTTLIQAALGGRRAIGNDINPLWSMLCRPRLDTPDYDQIDERLATMRLPTVLTGPQGLPDSDLLHFYHPDTLMELRRLRTYLSLRDAAGTLDRIDDWIRMVALNRLTGHSPGFFSAYTLPPGQAASVTAQQKINRDRNTSPDYRNTQALIRRKSKALLKDGPVFAINPLLTVAPAWQVPIPDASASLVVTSPPFLDVLDYTKDNWLRAWFGDVDLTKVQMSHVKTLAEWQAMVRLVLTDLARIVRPGGHVAFEVGEIRRGTVLLEHLVWAAAEGLPFDRIGVLINGGSFTKTSSIWKVANNTKGTNTNRVVMLRRS